MAENTNLAKIKEVRILGDDGTLVRDKVRISPDAADVMVHDASEQHVNHASLQDFLFRKFPIKDTSVGQIRANGDEVSYFTVDPTRQSVWQGWYDYQDMTKKRLTGLYKVTKSGEETIIEYVGDFLLGQEKGIQADLTLEDRKTEEEKQQEIAHNIEQVIAQYHLANKKDAEDNDIPDYKVNSDGENILVYEPSDKAKELMFSFGDKSFWQAMIDRELENKDKLIGIYNKDGECVGHFEATRYNLEALKEVYKNGVTVAMDGDNPEQIMKWGVIDNDKAAMDLLVDLSKKSVYQHLIDLKDFWITLPFEVYNNDNIDPNTNNKELGLNIANKNDIAKLHFVDVTGVATTIEEGGFEE